MSIPTRAIAQFIGKHVTSKSHDKFLNPSVNGAGRRIVPSRTSQNDEASQCRIDQGQFHDTNLTKYTIVLQPNKEAASKGMKDFIAKYSTHAKLATMTIDLEANDGDGPTVEDIREGLLRDFQEREETKNFQ
jgi:hypothetical protein